MQTIRSRTKTSSALLLAFFMLLFSHSPGLHAQRHSPGLDSVIMESNNADHTASERIREIMAIAMRLKMPVETMDSLILFIDRDTEEGAKLYFVVRNLIVSKNNQLEGKVEDPLKTLAFADSLCAMGMTAWALDLLHMELYSYQANNMPDAFLSALKRTIRMSLTDLEDAIDDVLVLVARNGKEAVEILKVNPVDVILMDIQMPVMDGIEATEAIRAQGGPKASTPIIAMTANVMKDEVERCRKAGMDEYISKPFDTGQLLELLAGLLVRSRA